MLATRVLVTGASGFLGQALSCRLRAEGALVTPVSRHASTGAGEPWVQVTRYDGNDALLVGQDCVVHLAARVHVMSETVQDALAAYRAVNVDLSVNLAKQAAKAGVRRFVFISSIKALGEATALGAPFFADTPPAPEDAYGISKWEAEQGLQQLARETGMEVVIIRPPLVYGPGVKANFLSMMRWLYRGVPLPLGAVTHNRRSFVALGNLVDLIVVCTRHPAAANQTFLVSDGDDLSTAELLKRMGRALGRNVLLPSVPVSWLEWAARWSGKKSIYDRLCGSLQVDINKTRQLLEWTPPLTVDEGLRLVAKEFHS